MSLVLSTLFALTLLTFGHQAESQTWSWGGELRLRTQLEKNGDAESRLRERIRVRLGMKADVNEFIKVEARMATSTDQRNDDQTLGDNTAPGSRRRSFGLDLAYIEWNPYSFFKAYGGRFPQIHYRPGGSQLLFDEEISLEGVGAVAHYQIDPFWNLVVNAGSVYIRENYDSFLSLDETDNMINWGQARVEWQNEQFFATAGFGFFNFVGVKGKNFADLAPGGTAGGNSEDVIGVVKNPFLPKQYFFEAKYRNGDLGFGTFGELIMNTETVDQHRALNFGLLATKENWEAKFSYVSVDSDSVMSSFTNSDFAGGRTDATGTISSVAWQFAQNLGARATHSYAHVNVAGFERVFWYTHLDLTAQF